MNIIIQKKLTILKDKTQPVLVASIVDHKWRVKFWFGRSTVGMDALAIIDILDGVAVGPHKMSSCQGARNERKF